MHLVGFILRIYPDARSPECQIRTDIRNKSSPVLDLVTFVHMMMMMIMMVVVVVVVILLLLNSK